MKMKMKEILLTSLKILMVASIVVVGFAGGDLFEMFRDSILQQQGFAIPVSGFMFQVAAILCLVVLYPVDLMRDMEVAIFKRFVIISVVAILLTISLVNLILIFNTLLNLESVFIQYICFSAAMFSIVISVSICTIISFDSTDNQIVSVINVIQASCLTTFLSLITYQGAVHIELFSGLFPWTLIFTAFIAIYHSKIRWNQQNGIKEIA
ncbi:hypothetical protein NB501_00040 [Vibrio alginolyticus]|uniref:hypothetical protein n=1 Tax=Vibrio alginolyticus TaxID=663 RepID=UPI00215BB0FB|nr:hypothetical protein [Vibrio alginolyticus]MCR9573831.1 hypothetical protein [Vibrio alginolyticus]